MKFKILTTRALVTFLILAQVTFGLGFLFTPKPAQAQFVGITFNTEIGNVYDIAKDVALGAAQRIAIQYANKYLQKFVDKLIDKYRIKDYLAYDKVLSGYYLNQYIYKNVDDPDLRAIYGILATDVNTRATAVDSKGNTVPVLAALREKLDTYYYNQGGIQSSLITNPGANVTDEQYFAAAQAYFANPPSFSDQQLYGQFGQMVADSQKASAQEIAGSAGTGFKNDRSTPDGTVPHICEFTGPLPPGAANPRDSEANCIAVGGTWKVDVNGIASSVIQNPAGFVHDFATSAINSIFTSNFGIRDNIYTTIGSLLGNFIFTKLSLTKSTGTFNETGSKYIPPAISDTTLKINGIDIDGDGIDDAQDADGDGEPDFCIYGGIPTTDPTTGDIQYNSGPPCLGSKAALTVTNPGSGSGPTCADVPSAASCSAPDNTALVRNVKSYVVNVLGRQLNSLCDVFEIPKRVAWAMKDQGVGLLTTTHTTQCNGLSAEYIAYTDNSGVDILGDSGPGGANTPAWNAVPASTEAGVRYTPATDPGDPADACYFTLSCP